jgi:putative selenium metabolism protein SsnA
MSGVTILDNGDVLTGWASPEVIPGGAVAWRDDRIVAVGAGDEVRSAHPDATYVDARGGLILPGLVNLHHHFYSALARGLDPGVAMRDFPEILDRLWWRLDRALDEDTIRLSALLSVSECVRWGCTTVFDHHASPSSIGGSLDLIADAVETAGISAVLCYEVTDRNGQRGAAEGIRENLRFLEARHDDPRIRGVLGLHASFTVGERTMARVADERPRAAGVHVHVAEHPVDVEASVSAFAAGPMERLERHGLLDDRALLAHAIHLEARDYERAAAAGATLIHNPESNANNSVGRLDIPRVADFGCAVGLGTDGMASALLRALRYAFLGLRGGSRDPTTGFDHVPALLATNARVAGRFLDEPRLGELSPGAPADLIAVDAPAPTPIGPDNWFGHLVYGASEAPVRHTVARGRVLLQDFKHTTLEPVQLARDARRATPGLWERFHSLECNTPYLGPGADAGEEAH